MIAAVALALAVQWAPPVARTNSPPPPVVTVTHIPPPPGVAVPAPPLPKAAPAPLPPGVRIVRPPQPRARLQQLVSHEDYPASALRRREQGRAAFALDVGENGRVTGCTITRSSGSAALDSSTCMIMVRRARFTPAMDSSGMPRAGRVTDELEWRLPEPAGPERG